MEPNAGVQKQPSGSSWENALQSLPAPPQDWVAQVHGQLAGLAEIVDAINSQRRRPLRFATPCAGFEAPYFALRQLGIQNFEQTFVVDVASHASKFCRNMRHAKKTWLGPAEGDLLRLDLSHFPSADILVAGPPCPPWSKQGTRRCSKDPRAEVFWRVIELIAELAGRLGDDALRCFILENVEGIKMEDSHGSRGIDEVMRRLRAAAPAFKIRVYDMNSQDYSLPQSRARVYIVGVHRSLEVRGRSFCTPPKHAVCPRLEEWLVPMGKVPEGFLQVPERLRDKKRKWAAWEPNWKVACADIDRDVDSGFSKLRFDGLLGTITAQFRSWLWIRQSAQEGVRVSQRSVMPVELLHLQGFPARDPLLAKALQGLSDKEVVLGAGNAMSVPVIGSVLADIFVKTLVGRLDAATEVSDSEDLEDGPDVATSFPRFKCGCWLHLRTLPSGPEAPAGAVSVHSGRRSEKLLLGRDPRRAAGLLEAEQAQEASVISRVHAEIIPGQKPGEAYLRDLGSTNGSWVVGRGRVSPDDVEGEALASGDAISLGVDPVTWQGAEGSRDFRFLFFVEMPARSLPAVGAVAPKAGSPGPKVAAGSPASEPEPEEELPTAAAVIAALDEEEQQNVVWSRRVCAFLASSVVMLEWLLQLCVIPGLFKKEAMQATRSERRVMVADEVQEYIEVDLHFSAPVYVNSCQQRQAMYVAEALRCASCPAACTLSAAFSRFPYVPDLLPKLQSEPECICGISYEEMQLRVQAWPGDQGFATLTDRRPAFIHGVADSREMYGAAIWKFDALLANIKCPNEANMTPALARIRRFGLNGPPLDNSLLWLRRVETAFGVEDIDRLLGNASKSYSSRRAVFLLPLRRTRNGRTRQLGLTLEELAPCRLELPFLVGPNGEPAESVPSIGAIEEKRWPCKTEEVDAVHRQMKAVMEKVKTAGRQTGHCVSDWRTTFPARGSGGPGGTSGQGYVWGVETGQNQSYQYSPYTDTLDQRHRKVGVLAYRRDFVDPRMEDGMPCNVYRWQLRLRAHNMRERSVAYTATDAVNGCWTIMEHSLRFQTRSVLVDSQSCTRDPEDNAFFFDPCCNLQRLRRLGGIIQKQL
ncbi:unnamed protein product [Effrenium voratum]|uniref:FHA domain-containing protein n=1 Tax=Effrenium voratum TaxID=2562239 RepID=A0AA36N1Y0_9DINO|nr:unnamed protein product [Effrenium voratum]